MSDIEENSYNNRLVKYEHIHSISDSSFDCLFKNVKIENSHRILDAGCGYGAISAQILNRFKEYKGDLYLVDSSQTQLIRALKNINTIPRTKANILFQLENISNLKLKKESFDIIFMKMLVHELPKRKQSSCFAEAFSLLKKGGKLIVWELALDKQTQGLFQSIINFKDEIAGFESLVRNRYFPRKEELLEYFEISGFKNIKTICSLKNPVITNKRLGSELKSENDLMRLNKFILDRISKVDNEIIQKLQLKGDIRNISFIPRKEIIVGEKCA